MFKADLSEVAISRHASDENLSPPKLREEERKRAKDVLRKKNGWKKVAPQGKPLAYGYVPERNPTFCKKCDPDGNPQICEILHCKCTLVRRVTRNGIPYEVCQAHYDVMRTKLEEEEDVDWLAGMLCESEDGDKAITTRTELRKEHIVCADESEQNTPCCDGSAGEDGEESLCVPKKKRKVLGFLGGRMARTMSINDGAAAER